MKEFDDNMPARAFDDFQVDIEEHAEINTC
jgi:hypothetical protein